MRAVIISILAALSLAGQVNAATIVTSPSFPNFTPTTFTPPVNARETLSQNWGVKTGWFWQNPDKGSLAMTSRMSAAEGQLLYKGISGGAPASMSAAKGVAGNALSLLKGGAGAVLLSVAAAVAYNWVTDHWVHTASANSAAGFVLWRSSGGIIANSWRATESGACAQVGLSPGSSPGPYGGHYCAGQSNYVAQASNFNCPANQSPVWNSSLSYFQCGTPASSVATDEQLRQAVSNGPNLSDAQLAELVALGFAVPTTKPVSTVIGDFSNLSASDLQFLQDNGYFTSPNGADFPMDSPWKNPATGEITQTRVALEAAPNGQLRVTTYDQLVDDAGDPINDANGHPQNSTNTDPCTANPDSPMCAPFGTGGDGPTVTDHALTLTSPGFSEAGQCPPDPSFSALGATITIPMSPVCHAATTWVKPLVVILAAIAAYFIFVGGLRT